MVIADIVGGCLFGEFASLIGRINSLFDQLGNTANIAVSYNGLSERRGARERFFPVFSRRSGTKPQVAGRRGSAAW
jgi:hypothetical protein